MLHFPILTLIVFWPIFGSFVVLAAYRSPRLVRWLSLGFTVVELGLVAALFFFDLKPHATPQGTWLLLEDYPWIPWLGARYSLGLDGISLILILLVSFINIFCVLISWEAIDFKVGSFFFFILFLEGVLAGLFLAADLLLFYLFWEVQIIPMFFLVGIWGHENRIHAAIKFLLYTLAGSLVMLIALLMIYILHGQATGVYTFSVYQLNQHPPLNHTTETLLFLAFLFAFGIKIPLLPVHTWLPDTHTEAPTAGSVDLAGLLLKTGVYALFRFGIPLFPNATKLFGPLLLALGVAGLFYAAWVALAQTDIKRLVAYSSISHMAMIILGLAIWNPVSLSGAILQMVNHGVSTSALFIMVGMLDERIHSRDFAVLGGLWNKMPVFSAFFLLFALSSLGLPGLNNFVGEMLILVGIFKARPEIAILGFIGVVFGVIYILRMVHDALWGEPRAEHVLWDVNFREVVILGVLALAVLFIGLHPGPVLKVLDQPIQMMIQQTTKVAWLPM
ncbi:MAG: NADH-quinone oxidoreductase subunit M [Deltaproteobacteria bacterium]|nr:NADH-quinone oxidoreductase subunit M [Deltaproteobacteria bacterium]